MSRRWGYLSAWCLTGQEEKYNAIFPQFSRVSQTRNLIRYLFSLQNLGDSITLKKENPKYEFKYWVIHKNNLLDYLPSLSSLSLQG